MTSDASRSEIVLANFNILVYALAVNLSFGALWDHACFLHFQN